MDLGSVILYEDDFLLACYLCTGSGGDPVGNGGRRPAHRHCAAQHCGGSVEGTLARSENSAYTVKKAYLAFCWVCAALRWSGHVHPFAGTFLTSSRVFICIRPSMAAWKEPLPGRKIQPNLPLIPPPAQHRGGSMEGTLARSEYSAQHSPTPAQHRSGSIEGTLARSENSAYTVKKTYDYLAFCWVCATLRWSGHVRTPLLMVPF
jgi:hypothetical protein